MKPKPKEDFLYTLQTGAESYIITKWDSIGLEQLSQYIMPIAFDDAGDPIIGCTCPQGLKPTCRHRKMLPALKPYCDLPVMYCYGTESYHGMIDGRLQELTLNQLDQLATGPEPELEADGDISVEDNEVATEIARIEAAKAKASEERSKAPVKIGEVEVTPIDQPAPSFKRRF